MYQLVYNLVKIFFPLHSFMNIRYFYTVFTALQESYKSVNLVQLRLDSEIILPPPNHNINFKAMPYPIPILP